MIIFVSSLLRLELRKCFQLYFPRVPSRCNDQLINNTSFFCRNRNYFFNFFNFRPLEQMMPGKRYVAAFLVSYFETLGECETTFCKKKKFVLAAYCVNNCKIIAFFQFVEKIIYSRKLIHFFMNFS